MNSFSSIQQTTSFYLRKYCLELKQSSFNRVGMIALAIIAFFALAYAALRFAHFKAEVQQSKHLDEQSNTRENVDEIEDIPQSLNPSLKNLKEGYAIIPLLKSEILQNLFADLKNFDAQPEAYKEQYLVKGQVEIGYASLKNKKVFVVRHQQIPEELKNFIPYVSSVHAIALNLLKEIEQDLCLEPGQLTETVSKTPLPATENSASLLRLFAYAPSNEEAAAADAHEDLGLLTIIPCSQVPALEVMNYQEDCQWVNVESLANASHAMVLVGRTLEQMTQGKYQAATHRVKKVPSKRFSIVYQLRAEPHTLIATQQGTLKVEDWLANLKKNLRSVNGSY